VAVTTGTKKRTEGQCRKGTRQLFKLAARADVFAKKNLSKSREKNGRGRKKRKVQSEGKVSIGTPARGQRGKDKIPER